MGKVKQALRTAWRIIKIIVLIVLIASILTLGYFVIHAWIGYGIYMIILGVAGLACIIIGSLILINQSEKNLEYDNQANLQRWVMAHTAQLRNPEQIPERITPQANPVDWNVRKTQDDKAYAVVPLLNGNPVWTAALPERFTPDYTGQMAAWDLALQLRSQPELTAGEGN